MQFAIQSSNKFLVNYSTSAAYSTTAIHYMPYGNTTKNFDFKTH